MRIRSALMMLILAVSSSQLSGCGCTYGIAGEVTVTPATSCLETL